MVLIYSKDVDDFVNQVIDCLEVDFIRINEKEVTSIEEMDFSNDSNSYLVKNSYLSNINLENITSAWFNGGCILSDGGDYENKCYEILNDTFFLQKTIKKIGKRKVDIEFNRLDVMLEAKQQGFKIPHTLITGNKTKLKDFFDLYESKNGIIAKRILDSYLYEDDEYLYNFNLTFPITPTVLNEVPNEFAISLFQERIIADFEIRVIYVDGVFYSACIYNFDNTVIDYRTKLRNKENLRIIPFQLPAEIENKLDKIFKRFNMNYGSADLMYSKEDYYFLEINPTGQISFINNACNFYIENLLATKIKNEQ
ncbi:hypothetical protein FIA58_002900 [Flavobacterium jejuense]|uniref:ATP-grasp domain-containing protein n=1 Tax=Flavobacterium jejuense TaxID=1544455 RepID=A0ABX0ILC1_9FLAO|nr:hypothetical protein [Flavobacterium jejuense]NHN24614.1 hypothetical protein [Flavobacterium jejuense]